MILLDTHVALWALADPTRLSSMAGNAIASSSEVAVAGITWYELAWLFDTGRVEAHPDSRTWLSEAAASLATIDMTWEIAHHAAGMSRQPGFPKDPADRLIYATAFVHNIPLITKDIRLRSFDESTCRW